MIARRALGSGPANSPHGVRAPEADLRNTLPGVRLPDLNELRARGVLATPPALPAPGPRRALGTGGHQPSRPGAGAPA
ncbi:hypothetical protein [Streptomyces fuscigenes]|uniref:hypothetical protein n=1 Tax=Streptomyces fuscigenes TaxID=1528880 RepID=UPI001F303FB9|nr:hypothetical protein [Streptomyces fuscigenes]MCF3960447.1 hypothetical protein [Streptomyces fuscigenes]